MAVPFNIPEDQNEVEVIIDQLQSLLTKLQAAVRRSRGVAQNPQPVMTRVRPSVPSRIRVRNDQPSSTTTSSTSTNLPDLLNNLDWLAATSQNSSAPSFPSSSQASIYPNRTPRMRTSSESSCCEETKISVSAILDHEALQDWNQENDNSDRFQHKNPAANRILSKFVPGPVSAPLWTAMICFVGWHLFRSR